VELFTPGHLLVLAIVVAVLFFGWKQLPDMARSLGRSLRIFKTEIKGMTEDDKAREAAKTTPVVEAAPPAAVPTPVTPVTPVVPATPVTPPADTTAPANSNGTSSVDHT
jgi:sec-independent protein translocase protein TatA